MKNRLSKKIMMALFIFASFILVSSCNWMIEKVFLRSYVAYYYEFKGIKFINASNQGSAMMIIVPKSISYVVGYGASEPDRQAKYDELCEHFGDMSYNRKVEIGPARPNVDFRTFYSNEYSSVEIISDSDYDDEHPAGSSLGNITRFMAVTPMPYIESGYKDLHNWDRANMSDSFYKLYYRAVEYLGRTDNGGSIHPIEKLISDLKPSDLRLFGGGYDKYCMAIEMVSTPTLSKIHNITLTMTTTKGEVFTATTELRFE